MTKFKYPNEPLTPELLASLGDAETVIFGKLDHPLVNCNLKLPSTIKRVEFKEGVFYDGLPMSITEFDADDEVDASRLWMGIEKCEVTSLHNIEFLPISVTSLTLMILNEPIYNWSPNLKELNINYLECDLDFPSTLERLYVGYNDEDFDKVIRLPENLKEFVLETQNIFCDEIKIIFNKKLESFEFHGCVNGQDITHHNSVENLTSCKNFMIESTEINSLCYPKEVETLTIKLYQGELSEIDEEYLDGIEDFDFTPYQHLISMDDEELYRKVVYLLRSWNEDNTLPSTLRELEIIYKY